MPRDEVNELDKLMQPIVSGIAEYLEPRGFSKHHYTFNKWTRDGLCHVFDLQMGVKSLEGEFTANLGIFIPEVYRSLNETEPPEFIPIGECCINARFSEFTDEDDKWWEITPYNKAVIQELNDLLQTYGLPFFIKFSDRQSIIAGLLAFDEKYGVAITPKLDIALMLEYLGKHNEAQKLFDQHYRESSGFKTHVEKLKKIAAQQKWDITK